MLTQTHREAGNVTTEAETEWRGHQPRKASSHQSWETQGTVLPWNTSPKQDRARPCRRLDFGPMILTLEF